MPVTAAQQKRYDGIGSIASKYLNDSPYPVTSDTKEIAETIMALESLGRTDRWRGRIRQWAAMVTETDEMEFDDDLARLRHIHWAIIQGMVYANYAAS